MAPRVSNQYPSYLTPRRVVQRPPHPPLAAAVGAYVVSYVAQIVAALPIGLLMAVAALTSDSASAGESESQAAVAATLALTALALIGAIAAGLFLRFGRARAPFRVAFSGEVASVAGGFVGGLISVPLGFALSVLCGVATMYVLLQRGR